jgi:exodeoxyribonuclease VII small subunit
MAEKPLTFEQALAKLEKLADAIEKGQIGLEESVAKYEEGMKLLKHCRQVLAAAEQRITQLHEEAGDPGDASEQAGA